MPTTKVSVTRSKLDELANVISDKSGENIPMSIDDMIDAVDGITPAGQTQTKTVTPTTSVQTVTPDYGYAGLSQVTVNAIPSQYIIPSGTVNITSNGTTNVTDFASANVDVRPPTATDNDVNFLDYDGTIVYSYSKDEFLALTSLPPNPTHPGLISQGWNWDLSDAKTYVTKYGVADIGQSYATHDGKTRFYIYTEIPNESVTFKYYQYEANAVEVDWGDGSTTDPQSTPNVTISISHTYSNAGNYVITVTCNSGKWQTGVGLNTYEPMVWGYSSNTRISYYSILRKIEFGNDYNFASASMSHIAYGAFGLETITIPNVTGEKKFGYQAFYSTFLLKCVIFPKNTTNLGYDAFYNSGLGRISLPCNAITLADESSYCRLFYNCRFPRVLFPDNTTNANTTNNYFPPIHSTYLHEAIIPDNSSITGLISQIFYNLAHLYKVTIPAGITDIAAQAFYGCTRIAEIHVKATTPPTVANVNAFTSMADRCRIYVPYSADHSILAAYKNAYGWGNRASYIFEESTS